MSESSIGALLLSITALITAAVAALINLKKQRQEERKEIRNGVIEEWREITNRLQAKIESQDKQIDALNQRIAECNQKFLSAFQEVAALRIQVEKRETERIEQRTDIRQLEKAVVELKQPEGK